MKLTYFNGRGLAETSRVLLEIGGEKYEDYRYPITVLDWSTYKMIRNEFDNDKKEGKLWKSMDKVPFLEVDGEVLFQSKSIERFLANRFKLMGSNTLEGAFIDSICETIRDFKDGYQKVRNSSPEMKECAMQVYFADTLPSQLVSLNNIIKTKQQVSEFVIGSKLSLADIVIFMFLTDFFDDKIIVANAYEKCDVLKAIVNNVGNLDKVKNWLQTRPQTPF
jgi:glutathione S-transferase